MIEFASMSPDEVQFIRLYVSTLKREYYLLRSVMDLMHPKNVAVENFAHATRLAIGLEELHQDFEQALRQAQRKNKLRVRPTVSGPTLDELADLFSLSFFKLITTTTPTNSAGKKTYDNGWFSGKPNEWKKTLTSYKGVQKEKNATLPDFLTDFFNAALKLFPFDNKTWLSNQSHLTKKIWPPDPKKWHMDDDDDEPDPNFDPFDWFFGHDDDDD